MLFKFGKFWKTIAILMGTWVYYGFFGFEFTVVTILSLILAAGVKDTTKFI
jgi:hypothetical protein